MKKFFINVRNFLINIKVYISRTSSYLSLLNTAMVLFLFLSNLEKYNIDIRIEDWIIPIFIVVIILIIFFGFLEDKLGFYSQEQKTVQSRSPYFKDINERLKRIEEKIERK
ncbi:hypothetical protein JW930_04970 [Candidatus Woesearchaeota archaeon]|nr:hypothetical protein [Candidatus Woesearchaeota archaeon]